MRQDLGRDKRNVPDKLLNRYTYVEGNPATMVDPFGLCANKSNSIGNSLLKGSEYALVKMLYDSGLGMLCKKFVVFSRQIFYGESKAVAEMNADAPVEEYLQLLADSADNQIAFDIGRYGTDLATLCSGLGLIGAGAGEEGGAVAFAAGTGGAGTPVAIAVAPAAAAQIGVGVDVTRVATSELFSPHVSVGGSSNASASSEGGFNSEFDKLLNSNAYKENFGYDCSEIAQDFMDAANGNGKIYRIEGKDGFINGYEYNSILEFDYHEVYSDGKFIYDPRYSNVPIEKGDYFRALKKINPSGFDVFTK